MAKQEHVRMVHMVPCACKIHRLCNVLEILIQIVPLMVQKGEPCPPWRVKNCYGMSPDHP